MIPWEDQVVFVPTRINLALWTFVAIIGMALLVMFAIVFGGVGNQPAPTGTTSNPTPAPCAPFCEHR